MNKIKFIRERWSDGQTVYDIIYWSGYSRTMYMEPGDKLPKTAVEYMNQPGIIITPSIDSIWGPEKVYSLK